MGTIAASLAAAASLLLPNTAFASTSIGSAFGDQPCGLPADTVQVSSSDPTLSFAVPTGGTSITDWFLTPGTNDTGSVNLLVWRPAGPLTFTLVAVSPTVDLSDPLSTFLLPAPIPVQPGDLIGLRFTGSVTCFLGTGDPGDAAGFVAGPALVGDTPSMFLGLDVRLNVAAAVEVASNPVAANTDQCKNGGWKALTDSRGNPFRNQGDCVSFVATKGKNLAAG